MKHILTALCFTLSMNFSSGQTLKSFNGPFIDGRSQNGNASYTYFEDSNTHEYKKQGTFKYTFKGQGDYSGFDQTISGNFENGLRHGTWTYIITMKDFGNANPYLTGTITLTAGYKKGYADGNWKEVMSYKSRKGFLVYGQSKWEPFEALKTMTINLNFKNGSLVGAVNIGDEFAKFKAAGSYDNSSVCVGTWIINDMAWGQNKELIYKDNVLYEYILRGNNGEVLDGTTKYQKDYDDFVKAKSMTLLEREDAGMILDTICGGDLCTATNNIKEYFPKLLSNEYFLYNFISGDLTFKEGFYGGCSLHVKTIKYITLSEDKYFIKAEDYYKKNKLLQAYNEYNNIALNNVRPLERKLITEKLAIINPQIVELVESYDKTKKFLIDYSKSQYDSLSLDKSYFASKISLPVKAIREGKYAADEKTMDKKLIYYSEKGTYEVAEPWENVNWDRAKSCFESNDGFYSSIQIVVTEQFFKYKKLLDTENQHIRDSEFSIFYQNAFKTFYSYDKNLLLNNLVTGKKEYNSAKSLIDQAIAVYNKRRRIETLDNQNNRIVLFSKYKIAYSDYNKIIQSSTDLQFLTDNYTRFNLFLDKVITMYSQDTKELENQLKKVETADQIKSIILGL